MSNNEEEVIKQSLNGAIQEGLEAGEKISRKLTPRVWEEIKENSKKPKIPTLEERIKMIDKKLEPDCMAIGIETCYIPPKQ